MEPQFICHGGGRGDFFEFFFHIQMYRLELYSRTVDISHSLQHDRSEIFTYLSGYS